MDKLEDIIALLGDCVKGLTQVQKQKVLDTVEQITWYIPMKTRGLRFQTYGVNLINSDSLKSMRDDAKESEAKT